MQRRPGLAVVALLALSDLAAAACGGGAGPGLPGGGSAPPPAQDPTVPRPAPVGRLVAAPGAASPGAPGAESPGATATTAVGAPAAASPGAAAMASDDRPLPGPRGLLGVEVFRARRRRLMEQMHGGAALVLGAAALDDGAQQRPDFYYLTGIDEEAGAALVLAPGERLFKEALYLRPRDPEDERWDGERPALGKALELATGFGRVRRASRLPARLSELGARYKDLVFLGPIVPTSAPPPDELEEYGKVSARVPGAGTRDASGLLAAMRAVKEPAELELMRRATAITEEGLRAAATALARRAGLREFELKEVIESTFRGRGARRLAFPSIVGSGPNSTILHYPKDDRIMRPGELVVCDVGAEVERYAADVTRTFPVGGAFSPEQREIYELVLRAQEAAMARVRPGAFVEDVHQAASDVIEAAGYHDYFIHGTSHLVGLEVHDVGDLSKPLRPGMVLTVEPGVYLPQRGFGVRIEDELLVTATGYELLSRGVPRRPEELERLLAQAREGR